MRKSLIVLGILTDGDVDWLIEHGRYRRLEPAAVIIAKDEPLHDLFILLTGSLQVEGGQPGGPSFAVLYPGEIIGEISLLDARAPSARVVAREHAVVLEVSHGILQARLQADLAFQARLYRALAVLLAARLRRSNLLLLSGADGAATPGVADELDEIDPAILEETALASSRFQALVSRVGG